MHLQKELMTWELTSASVLSAYHKKFLTFLGGPVLYLQFLKESVCNTLVDNDTAHVYKPRKFPPKFGRITDLWVCKHLASDRCDKTAENVNVAFMLPENHKTRKVDNKLL